MSHPATSRISKRGIILVALATFLALPRLAACGTISLTVFGDSLSDVGNLHFASDGFLPVGDYFEGRHSNGPLYVEQLGFETSHSLEGGSNYAISGAKTGVSLVGFPAQIESFSDANGGSVEPDSLSIVWFGGNDVIEGYETGIPAAAEASIAGALTVLEQSLHELIALGARNILLLNLPDLSLTPDVLDRDDPATSALARTLSQQWNAGLEQIISDLDSPGLQLVDVAALFSELIADPAAFGITNWQDRAIDSAGSDDEFLFWDDIHPTAKVHRILAARMRAELEVLAPCPPVITQITHNSADQSVSFVFRSRPDQFYVVEFSTSLASGWEPLVSSLPSEGESTRFVDADGPSISDRGYYRIRLADEG